MARCDQDDTCYRVFCVTLLAIALTFTLILTDVFMDIDGLIRANEKEKEQKITTSLPEFEPLNGVNIQMPSNDHDYPLVNGNGKPEALYEDIKSLDNNEEMKRLDNNEEIKSLDNNEEVEDTPFRTKRSLESLTYIDNPNVQNIIAKKISALLDPTDQEQVFKFHNNIKHYSNENSNSNDDYESSKENNNMEIKIETNKVEDDLLHLLMHNILLQGLLGHTNLNEVLKKVNNVIDNYDAVDNKLGLESMYQKKPKGEGRREYIQNKFYDELMHCQQLQTEISEHTKHKIESMNTALKEPKMFIKTVIDIKPLPKETSKNKKLVKDIDSVIKLIRSGESDKQNEVNDKDSSSAEDQSEKTAAIDNHDNDDTQEPDNASDDSYRNAFITNAIAAYLAKNPNLLAAATSKRLKRNVKVKKHSSTTHKPKAKTRKSKKAGDDELYVEIETHFDGKGIKGAKKQKLVKNIIDKIQKAIHNNLETIHVHDRNAKQFKIRRRVQNPLESIRNNVLINKFIVPIDNYMRRDSAPLSKTNPAGNSPYVDDSVGDNWRKPFIGPHFLSGAKAINSAELGEINVNYEKTPSAIPQRLQVPLNADDTDDNLYELGNMKFYIKELDGTGFSIGFNQYLGEPPDEDSMKSFTGIDNLIKTYRSKYEDDVNNNPVEKNENDNDVYKARGEKGNDINEMKKLQRIAELPNSDEGHELRKREVRRMKDGDYHKVNRRSTENNDFHSNEYKIIFNNNFLPYHTYQDILSDKKKRNKKMLKWPFLSKFNLSNSNEVDMDEMPFLIDNNIINKKLKPSEILGLANLLGRNKRSIRKFSKINMSKLRFINTNQNPKRIILKGKKPIGRRLKRQIDNIRILTADGIHNMPLHRHSEENVLVLSNEDLFPNRMYNPNEIEIPENFELPEKPEEAYNINYGNMGNSMLLETPRQPTYSNIFGGLSRHNALMSKYPHIFMEEISRSKEEEAPNNNPYINEYNSENQQQRNVMDNQDEFSYSQTSTENPMMSMFDIPTVPKVKEIVDAIIPKSNYKLTVKILPRNMSFNGFPSGFKEIHTSINKSITKNGLLISSLLNVSEISKVEKVNNDSDVYEPVTVSPLVRLIKSQQEKMKLLLKQHKKKIDEQLDHLNKEKMNLENIIVDKHERHPQTMSSNSNNLNNGADQIEVMLPSDPPQLLHLTTDEAGQLISSALMKLKETPRRENKVTNAPVKKPQPQPTTQQPIDPEKMRIINTIQHNENLTTKILGKIDRNTEILQRFLQKFADRLDNNMNRNDKNNNGMPPSGFNNNANNNNGFPKNGNIPMNYQTHWKDRIRDPFFKQTLPNLELKNDTHVSIPFVYAYQQPYPNNKLNNAPIASVVYQGHIHTNAVRGPYNEPKLQYDQKIKPYPPSKYQEPLPKLPIGNQTKFFLDGDVNDFKLAKDEYGASLGTNITNIS